MNRKRGIIAERNTFTVFLSDEDNNLHYLRDPTTTNSSKTPTTTTAMAGLSLEGIGRAGAGVGGSMGVRMRKASVPIVSPRSLEIPAGHMPSKSLSRSGSPARYVQY